MPNSMRAYLLRSADLHTGSALIRYILKSHYADCYTRTV